MRIKQILVALFFTVLIVSCGKENTKEADAKKEIIKKEGPKEAGEKAGKEVCEKIKSGDFTQSDAQKFMKEAQSSIDNEEDAAIWLEAYMATAMKCN